MDRNKRVFATRLSAACLSAALLTGCDSAPPATQPTANAKPAATIVYNPATNQAGVTQVSDQAAARIIAPVDSAFERLAMLLPPIADDGPELSMPGSEQPQSVLTGHSDSEFPTRNEFEALSGKPAMLVPQASSIPVVAEPSRPAELPPASRIVRTTELMNVGQRAEAQVRVGFELAERGAVYSAKIEFTQALETLAQTYDAQLGSNIHAKALAAGLRALQESDDFLTRDGQLQSDVNVPLVVAGHQTPVLQGDAEYLTKISPLQAVQQYLTYAQQQLSLAAGPEPAGSLALYGLGKLYTGSDRVRGAAALLSPPKAVVFHQAALMANPKNFLAANELGVLLAKFGRLPDAKRLLLMSVTAHGQAAAWRNLAVVHQSLGEADLSRRAMEEARLADLAAPRSPTAPYQLQWVDAATFARDSVARSGANDASASSAKPATPPSTTQPPAGARKSLAEQMPWSATRR